MIAVKVADKNMGDAVITDFVFQHLHLSAFAAVNKKMTVAKDQQL